MGMGMGMGMGMVSYRGGFAMVTVPDKCDVKQPHHILNPQLPNMTAHMG